MELIEQSLQEHEAELGPAARIVLPVLGYTVREVEAFLEEQTQSQGSRYRVVSGDGRDSFIRTRAMGDSWNIAYIVPEDWPERYISVRYAVDCLKEQCRKAGPVSLFMGIRETPPSINAYFAGMLPLLGFEIKARADLSAPLSLGDGLVLTKLPSGIEEIQLTEDRLTEAAEIHWSAFSNLEPAQSAEDGEKERLETVSMFEDDFRRDDSKTWIALAEGKRIVGICIGRHWPDQKMLAIHELAVAPEYQGRGLGRYLSIRCMEELKKYYGTEGSRYGVGTSRTWFSAYHLYQSLGFEVDEFHLYARFTAR